MSAPSHGRVVEGDVELAQAGAIEPVRADELNPLVSRVVQEQHRPLHRGQLADRLAEPVVERVGGRPLPVGVDLGEHPDEDVE